MEAVLIALAVIPVAITGYRAIRAYLERPSTLKPVTVTMGGTTYRFSIDPKDVPDPKDAAQVLNATIEHLAKSQSLKSEESQQKYD